MLDLLLQKRRDTTDGDKAKNKAMSGIDMVIPHQQLQSKKNWEAWPPWPASTVEGRPAQSNSSYTVQPANPRENLWTDWTKEAQEAQPARRDESRLSS